jgi:hypothetical protein
MMIESKELYSNEGEGQLEEEQDEEIGELDKQETTTNQVF